MRGEGGGGDTYSTDDHTQYIKFNKLLFEMRCQRVKIYMFNIECTFNALVKLFLGDFCYFAHLTLDNLRDCMVDPFFLL